MTFNFMSNNDSSFFFLIRTRVFLVSSTEHEVTSHVMDFHLPYQIITPKWFDNDSS